MVKVCQNHNGKFQSFGTVNTHQGNTVSGNVSTCGSAFRVNEPPQDRFVFDDFCVKFRARRRVFQIYQIEQIFSCHAPQISRPPQFVFHKQDVGRRARAAQFHQRLKYQLMFGAIKILRVED